MLVRSVAILLAAALLTPSAVHAHTFGTSLPATIWTTFIAVALLCSATVAVRAYQLRRASTHARMSCGLFATGWVTLAVALISPIDYYGEWLFSIHMVQHLLVMNVAVPLLLLARPERYLPAAAPRFAHAWSAADIRRHVITLWRKASSIEAGFVINALAIWLWHIPRAHEWALASSIAHMLQHSTFVVAALLFWAGIWRALGRTRSGLAILSLFATAVHTGVLGAFLSLSNALWYKGYSPESFGIGALADQQFAGLIMWIPGGVTYVVAALMLMSSWLRFSDRIIAR